MKFSLFFIVAMAFLVFSGCASFEASSHIMAGRQELLTGRPERALGQFKRAAQLTPHYVTNFTVFTEGVWTYVGRAHYQMGELKKARAALERALREHPDDLLVRIYLGLVLMRQGETREGLREARGGLKMLDGWLRELHLYDPDGIYWDPDFRLENEINDILAAMEGRDLPPPQIIARLEWLGREFEEEIDAAKEDEMLDREEDDDDGDGVASRLKTESRIKA